MALLTSGDLKQILDAVATLNSGVDLLSLRERSLNCVLSLIPNEMTAFDGFDSEGYYDGSLWYSPEGTVPVERVQLLGELVHEHPYFQHLIEAPEMRVTRTSDAMPLDEFHKTALYNEFYRTFEGEAQMSGAMRLSPTSVVTCSIHRPSLDFSDREFEMWRLVVPHLKAAFKNAQFVDQLDQQRRYLNQLAVKGVVVMNSEGKITFESDLARQLINSYFSGRSGGSLPGEIVELVNIQAAGSQSGVDFDPQRCLTVSNGRSELRITASFNTREREVLIFLEERRPYDVSDFEKAGLSRREAEILFWVGRGKTDPEIATLLSISPRTVHKHLEHIFTKLGVETRTAAVLQTIDFFI